MISLAEIGKHRPGNIPAKVNGNLLGEQREPYELIHSRKLCDANFIAKQKRITEQKETYNITDCRRTWLTLPWHPNSYSRLLGNI